MPFITVEGILHVSHLQSDVWNAARNPDESEEVKNLGLVDEGDLTV
jgi:hypothetical protein